VSVAVPNVCVFPNGIEAVEDYVLVGCSDGIYRIDLENNYEKTKVTDLSGAVTTIDGLKYDEDSEILYAVINGFPIETDKVVAVASNDDWVSLDLLYVFQAGCPQGYPATAAVAGGSLFTVCLGCCDMGPYEIRYVSGVNEVVTNGADVYENLDSGSSSNDDDDMNIKKKLRIAVLVLALFCGVLILLVLAGANSMRNIHIARSNANDRDTNNPLHKL
jgi:hypothetical protein